MPLKNRTALLRRLEHLEQAIDTLILRRERIQAVRQVRERSMARHVRYVLAFGRGGEQSLEQEIRYNDPRPSELYSRAFEARRDWHRAVQIVREAQDAGEEFESYLSESQTARDLAPHIWLQIVNQAAPILDQQSQEQSVLHSPESGERSKVYSEEPAPPDANPPTIIPTNSTDAVEEAEPVIHSSEEETRNPRPENGEKRNTANSPRAAPQREEPSGQENRPPDQLDPMRRREAERAKAYEAMQQRRLVLSRGAEPHPDELLPPLFPRIWSGF